MIEHVNTRDSSSSDPPFDLDALMDSLLQGRGQWVYQMALPVAEAGVAKAQLLIGILFQIGAGVTQDGPRAVHYYRLAAAQGDVLAWRNLGTLYLLGLAGIEVDKAEAHRCFTSAHLIETRDKAKELLAVDVIH